MKKKSSRKIIAEGRNARKEKENKRKQDGSGDKEDTEREKESSGCGEGRIYGRVERDGKGSKFMKGEGSKGNVADAPRQG